MAIPALIVSQNPDEAQVVERILESRGMKVEHCAEPEKAVACLAEQHLAMVIVDCADESAALELIRAARTDSANRNALLVAIVDAHNDTRELFDQGVNFIMYKPVTAERSSESLQAAWSLLPPERRRKERVQVSTQASITFATTEDAPVPLLNVSEDGLAIHSQNKMPPPCKVYFQFTLPGQSDVVRLAAEVTWQDWRGRVGLHFAHVPQASRRVLNEWLKKNPNRQEEHVAASETHTDRFVLPTPEPRIAVPGSSTLDDDRRNQARRLCRLGVNVYRPAGSVIQHCMLTDVSAGGCYIETTDPLSEGTRLVIEVRNGDWKLHVHGKVRSMHRGYGMGVEFRLKTTEDNEDVKRLLACLDAQANVSIGREI